MKEDVEIMCNTHADEVRAQREFLKDTLFQNLMEAEIRRRRKRMERRKQYRWEVALIRISRIILILMCAGLAWMGCNKMAASGVLISAFFYCVELDRLGKLDRMRGDSDVK